MSDDGPGPKTSSVWGVPNVTVIPCMVSKSVSGCRTSKETSVTLEACLRKHFGRWAARVLKASCIQ